MQSTYNFVKDLTFYRDDYYNDEKTEDLVLEINNLFKKIITLDSSKNEKKKIFRKIILKTHEVFTNINNNYSQADDNEFHIFINELSEKTLNQIKDLRKFYLKKFNQQEDNNTLEKEKFEYGSLQESSLKKIEEIAKKYDDYFNNQIKLNKLDRESLTVNTGKDIRKIINILNKDFKDQGILKKISNYVKHDFAVTGCAIELSVPGSSWWKGFDPRSSELLWYTHLDQSLRTPKSIVYLTDVKINNGPTSFFPKVLEEMKLNFLQDIVGRNIAKIGRLKKSKLYNYYISGDKKNLNSDKFIKHFNKLPGYLKFEAHLGWYVKKNSSLEKLFVDKEKKFLGSMGSFVIFDGAKVFHKGGLIEKGKRLVLQVTFGEKKSIIKKIITKIKSKYF